MGTWPYLLLAIAVGCGIALQAPINAAFSTYMGGDAFVTALLSVCITLFLLSTVVIFWTVPIPVASFSAPLWWVWGGGVMGALIVAGSILSIGKLGAAGMFTVIVASQMILAIVLDHFGWFGLTQQSLSLTRVCGVLMLVGGVVLVKW